MTKPLSPLHAISQVSATDRIRLRPLTAEDLPMTLAWRNQEKIRRWFLHSEPITFEQHRQWFERYLVRENDLMFVIEECESGAAIGQISLYDIDLMAKRCEFGRLLIAPEAQNNGYATDATRAALTVGFDGLGLEEIYLIVLKDNSRARAIYERCGFTLESVEGNQVKMTARKFLERPTSHEKLDS